MMHRLMIFPIESSVASAIRVARAVPVIMLALGAGAFSSDITGDQVMAVEPPHAEATAHGGAQSAETRAWQVLTLKDKTALSYALVLPDGFDATQSHPLLVALPPGNQSAEMVEVALSLYWEAEAKKSGWILASPIAPAGRPFADSGADLVTALADDLIGRYAIEGSKYHLAGVSNGGRSAFRVALAHPEKIASITVLPGLVDSDEDMTHLDRLRGIPIAMYVGERDTEWKGGMQELSKRLTAAGVSNTFEVAPGQDHVIRNLTMATVFRKLDAARKR